MSYLLPHGPATMAVAGASISKVRPAFESGLCHPGELRAAGSATRGVPWCNGLGRCGMRGGRARPGDATRVLRDGAALGSEFQSAPLLRRTAGQLSSDLAEDTTLCVPWISAIIVYHSPSPME